MTGNEIITILQSALSTIGTPVLTVAGSILSLIFYRNKTATKEFEIIKAGLLKEAAEELLASGTMTYTEFYKTNNFLLIAERADEIYRQKNYSSTVESLDFDWFVRFYEASGNISNEYMQELWAKILAEEINKQGTFSLRTIETLRNMNANDAKLFEKICEHSFVSFKDYFLPKHDKYTEKYGISYASILKLGELGLINDNGMIRKSINISPDGNVICDNNDYLIMGYSKDNTTNSMDVAMYLFTSIGNEIASINNLCASNVELQFYANILNKDSQIEICVHKINSKDDEMVSYSKENVLQTSEEI